MGREMRPDKGMPRRTAPRFAQRHSHPADGKLPAGFGIGTAKRHQAPQPKRCRDHQPEGAPVRQSGNGQPDQRIDEQKAKAIDETDGSVRQGQIMFDRLHQHPRQQPVTRIDDRNQHQQGDRSPQALAAHRSCRLDGGAHHLAPALPNCRHGRRFPLFNICGSRYWRNISRFASCGRFCS